MDLSDVLWIGGPERTCTSAVAQAISRRFELRLYELDGRASAHEPRMPAGVESFVSASRHRFRLVLEDLCALPEEPGAVVVGRELLPTSVSAVLRTPAQALFLLPDSADELAARYAREARELRLTALRADRPLDELVELAVEQFGPLVDQRFRR